MTREETIRRHFKPGMRLLELGPSYNPIVPKKDGWQTTVIDHCDRAELLQKYGTMGVATIDRIEDVDFVWRDGTLTDLIPQALHGSYDGLVASHVGEHFPDLIAFFNDASRLLKPTGLMALALPDKRVCFDFFQPLTTTGDLVDAHRQGRTRHQKRTFFNQAAYLTFRGDDCGWAHTGNTAPFRLMHSLSAAQAAYDAADDSPGSVYADTHAWAFTPKSFELLMLELNVLKHVDWAIHAIEPAGGVEFYVWLGRKQIALPEEVINPLRLGMLADIARETRDAIDQLDAVRTGSPAAAADPRPLVSVAGAAGQTPGITAILPLYNGARYIEQALHSVLRQTLKPEEIIVIDDGSTDGGEGAAIVRRIAETHPVRLLQKPNGGQSSARNLGVREARGALIAFLDQDDVWYDNHLEELVKPFMKPSAPPLGWAYSNLDEIDENDMLICRSFLDELRVANPKRHIFECIRADMFILPSASLIARAAFEAVGGFDERLCGYEDDDLFMRMFRLGYDNVYVNQPLSRWRIYPGSTSYTYRMRRSRGVYARKLLELFPDDVKRNRYYARDLIIPRFFDQAVQEYTTALAGGDPAAIAETRNEVMMFVGRNPQLAPRLLADAMSRYKQALAGGDEAAIGAARAEAAELALYIPGGRLRATLHLLRNPAVAKSLFAVRRFARPAMLWALSA